MNTGVPCRPLLGKITHPAGKHHSLTFDQQNIWSLPVDPTTPLSDHAEGKKIKYQNYKNNYKNKWNTLYESYNFNFSLLRDAYALES